MELTINLPLKVSPVLELAFEMVEFLMRANQELEEKLEKKSRSFERTKATIEQNVEDLQFQKAQLEYEKEKLELEVRAIKAPEIKVGDTELAIVPVPESSGLKRKLVDSGKFDCGNEDAGKRGSSWKGRPPWAPLPPLQPEVLGSGGGVRNAGNEGEGGGGGGGGPVTENGSPPREELSGCDGGWNAASGGRSNMKVPTAGFHNKDGSLGVCKTSTPNTVPKVLTGKKRGRKPKGTVVQAPETEARLPLVRSLGGSSQHFISCFLSSYPCGTVCIFDCHKRRIRYIGGIVMNMEFMAFQKCSLY